MATPATGTSAPGTRSMSSPTPTQNSPPFATWRLVKRDGAVTLPTRRTKACIDHKSGLTPGGHNISTDIIPNDIAARCLDLGRRMLDEEAAWLTTDPEKARAHFSP